MAYDQHIRTEEELNLQLKHLIEIKKVHEKYNIRMRLSAGTLLGAVREKDFIKWDWNVSVESFHEEFFPHFENICSDFEALGYKIKKRVKKGYVAVNIFKDGIKFVIEACKLSEDGKYRTLPMYKWPSKFFKDLEAVELRGEKFLAPKNPEKFLEWYYGADWQTPKMIGHRSEVITKECYRNKQERK